MKNSKYILVTALLLLFINSCKSQDLKTKNSCLDIPIIKTIMINEVKNLKEENFKLNNSIVKKIGIRKEHDLSFLINPDYFEMIRDIKRPKSKEDIVNYRELFSKEDFDFMKCQIDKNSIDLWSDIINKEELNTESIDKKREVFYSVPIFDKDKNYAFLYVETLNGGNLKVYSKSGDDWECIAIAFFYTSD